MNEGEGVGCSAAESLSCFPPSWRSEDEQGRNCGVEMFPWVGDAGAKRGTSNVTEVSTITVAGAVSSAHMSA